MATLIDTFTQDIYTAKVFDDAMVEVFKNDVLIDNPGPWGDVNGAAQWAEAIVGKYATEA